MLYGDRIATCTEVHTKHVTKAESCYRLRSYRAENSSLYLRLLTSSDGLWNSNGLIVVLPSGGGPWNSKRHVTYLCITEFVYRYIIKWLVFTIEVESVYSTVPAESFYIKQITFLL
jgi:hypothetical protein